MMRIYIQSNTDELPREALESIISNLDSLNIDYALPKELSMAYDLEVGSFDINRSDYIFVIGGDRLLLETLLGVRSDKPVVVPLSGKVSRGFFTIYSYEDIPDLLTDIIKGRFSSRVIPRLTAFIDGDETPPAFNDIVILNSKSGKLIRYTLYVNGEYIWRDTSDGIIISTPIGSTGYSLSAGGPIIKDAYVVSIVPINTLIPSHKPIVTSMDSEILVSGLSRGEYVIIIDGQYREAISSDNVRVVKSRTPIRMLDEVYRGGGALDERLSKRISPSLGKDILKGLPPSAKYVYRVLEYEGLLTFKELVARTALPPRTVRHALRILMDRDLVKKMYLDKDARISTYKINR